MTIWDESCFEGIIYSTLIMTSEKNTTGLIAKDFLPLNAKHP